MPSMIKYGHYWISAGIAVAGAIWLARPGDPRVLGEDMADLYEAEAERSVIPFLTGSQVPDWAAYNNGSTNTVDVRIRYDDVDALCNRIRANFLKAGPVFWLISPITNGQELSISQGTYAITNKAYNPLGYTPTVTNITYSYSTNRYVDNLIVTSSRQWTNSSLFEYCATGNGSPMSMTNAPVSSYVWSKTASAVAGSGLTLGSAWPLARSYTFPWEQWSDVNRSRVSVFVYDGDNIIFTNASWISMNRLTFTNAPALRVTSISGKANPHGFCLTRLMDIYGNTSVEFVVIKPPASNNGIVLPAYSYSIAKSASWTYITITKSIAIQGEDISAELVYGDDQLEYEIVANELSFASLRVRTAVGVTNNLSVLKFTSTDSQASPAYCAFSFTPTIPNPLILTNSYFSLTQKAYINEPVIATATTNAIAQDQIIMNDKRITTNKLYDICHVLTNLHTTVYMGATVTPTQNVVTVQTSTDDFGSTYYVDEYQTGSGLTPTYYSAYTMADIIAANDTRSFETNVIVNQGDVTSYPFFGASELAFYSSSLYDYHEGDIFANSSTNWTSWVVVAGRSKVETYKYKGCSINYPSDWAVTNGYVKNVKVYAILQVQRVLDGNGIIQYPFPANGYTNNFTISGSYWYAGNINCTEPTLTFSRPATNINTTISNSAFHSFDGFFDDDRVYWYFTDKTPVNLIAEIDNPTEPIRFDMPDFDFSYAYPDRFNRIQAASAGPTQLRDEYERTVYDLEYRVGVVRWIVQVEWNFPNLNNGFVPVTTNIPSWRTE